MNDMYILCYQNDVIKNFTVIMSAVVKRVDCSSAFIEL